LLWLGQCLFASSGWVKNHAASPHTKFGVRTSIRCGDLSVGNPDSSSQRKFWRVFGIGVLLLVLYIPFGVALNVSPEIDLASVRVLVPVFFLVWLLAAVILRKKLFVSNLQGFGLISILTISAASIFFAEESGWGIRKLAVFLSVFPLYFLSAGLAGEKTNYKKIADVLILGALISSIIGLFQFLSQFFISSSALVKLYSGSIGPIFWGKAFSGLVAQNPSWFVNVGGATLMRAFGLFPDPHMLAFFVGLVSPLALVRIMSAKKTNFLSLFAYGLMFVVLLLTFSRGGYLGLFFSIIVVLFYAWRFLSEKKRSLILAGLALCLLILIIFAAPVVSRFISSFLLSEGSSLGRIQIWRQSSLVFLEKPIFGVGLGNYPRAVDPLAVYRSPVTSHNLYLDIASETGIFGLAVWLLLIFGSFYQLVRTIGKNRTARDEKIKEPAFLKIGLAGSLGYFAVHSLFETSVFNPAVLACLMVIFALISIGLKHAQ
jgi:O-antigen ligase